jgi:hypothetical protein
VGYCLFGGTSLHQIHILVLLYEYGDHWVDELRLRPSDPQLSHVNTDKNRKNEKTEKTEKLKHFFTQQVEGANSQSCPTG